jgi:hypothetical protein
MQEKKKITSKLESYKEKLKPLGKKYSANNKSFSNEITKLIDNIETLDVAGAKEFQKVLYSWLDAIVREINLTIGDIDWVIGLFNNKKVENSIVYKALNFKELK